MVSKLKGILWTYFEISMYTTINPLKSLLPTNQHRYMDAKLRAELHSCSSLILYVLYIYSEIDCNWYSLLSCQVSILQSSVYMHIRFYF